MTNTQERGIMNMATKTGAGGKQQNYNTNTGKYENQTVGGKSKNLSYQQRLKNIVDKIKRNKQKSSFKKPAPQEFYKTLSKTKEDVSLDKRWRVDLHNVEDYKNDKLFITDKGSCVAVEPSGNIISVCQNPNDSTRGWQLLEKAVQEGGDRLDAFGPDLFDFYTKNGFEPVSWTPFNEEYAPEEWLEARKQGVKVEKEPVIFYKYTGKYNRENNPYNYGEFLKATKPSADYDTAQDMRDKEIK